MHAMISEARCGACQSMWAEQGLCCRQLTCHAAQGQSDVSGGHVVQLVPQVRCMAGLLRVEPVRMADKGEQQQQLISVLACLHCRAGPIWSCYQLLHLNVCPCHACAVLSNSANMQPGQGHQPTPLP